MRRWLHANFYYLQNETRWMRKLFDPSCNKVLVLDERRIEKKKLLTRFVSLNWNRNLNSVLLAIHLAKPLSHRYPSSLPPLRFPIFFTFLPFPSLYRYVNHLFYRAPHIGFYSQKWLSIILEWSSEVKIVIQITTKTVHNISLVVECLQFLYVTFVGVEGQGEDPDCPT